MSRLGLQGGLDVGLQARGLPSYNAMPLAPPSIPYRNFDNIWGSASTAEPLPVGESSLPTCLSQLWIRTPWKDAYGVIWSPARKDFVGGVLSSGLTSIKYTVWRVLRDP